MLLEIKGFRVSKTSRRRETNNEQTQNAERLRKNNDSLNLK
jgi:hypothetical protein